MAAFEASQVPEIHSCFGLSLDYFFFLLGEVSSYSCSST